MMEDKRKFKIGFATTPAELRDIAEKLESAQFVCVNWYHTELIFENGSHKPN